MVGSGLVCIFCQYFLVKTIKKTGTESTIDALVTTRLPTYSVGRPATMMEVGCWMPNMPERDFLVTSPEFIALLRLTTNERAQLRVPNTPSTRTTVHTTTEQQLTASSTHKWHPTHDVTLCDAPTTRTSHTTQDPPHVHPPDDVPEEQIPPKPPYGISPITSLLRTGRDVHRKPKAMLGSSMEWSVPLYGPTSKSFPSRYSKQKPQTKLRQICMTTLDPQQGGANS